MIRIQNLTKKFGDTLAVDGLTLDVKEGEVFGFLGPNGAGKTTTVRMLTSLIGPTSGSAIVNGYPLGERDIDIRRTVGILTETPGLYDNLSAEYNLGVYAKLYEVSDPDGQVEKYLRMLGLWERRYDAAGTFSKGMKQKLAIARALLHEPIILFLDEPTAGLDPEAARLVRDFIAELSEAGRTIFMCTHNLDEADRLCDRIAVFKTRLLVVDAPAALRSQLFGRKVVFHLRRVDESITTLLSSIPGASDARVIDNKLVVTLDNPEEKNPDIIRLLVERGDRRSVCRRTAPFPRRGLSSACQECVRIGYIRRYDKCHYDHQSGIRLILRVTGIRMNKIVTIIQKEWAEVFRNRLVVFTIVFLPLIMAAIPLGILFAMRGEATLADAATDFPEAFDALCPPELAGGECFQVYMVSQFMLMFMILPLVIPATFAAYSIVGEKTTHSLEPLLATPITTVELLVGKSLAAVVPAILATYAAFGIYALGAYILISSPVVFAAMMDARWLIAVIVVGPLSAVMAVMASVMVSSRVNDPRVAEQLSMVVIVPLLAVFFGQIAGLFIVDSRFVILSAMVLVVVDVILVYIAVQLFQRETILTRWKS